MRAERSAGGSAKCAAERVAVVKAGVPGHRDTRLAVEAGRALGVVSVCGRRMPAAEADGAICPLCADLPVVGQCGQHGGQLVRGAGIVQLESADRLHREEPFSIRDTDAA